jgi:hypothetical protein
VPTYATTRRFQRDLQGLTPKQRKAFREAVERFVDVKGVRGAGGVFEMAWGDGGRATLQYGPEIDVIWRRVVPGREVAILGDPSVPVSGPEREGA